MNNWQKILMLGAMCSCVWSIPAAASTNLETGSSLAGISVALNNYYAGTTEPEQKLADSYMEQNPGTQINITVMPWSGAMDKIVSAIMEADSLPVAGAERTARARETAHRLPRVVPAADRPQHRSPRHRPMTILLCQR